MKTKVAQNVGKVLRNQGSQERERRKESCHLSRFHCCLGSTGSGRTHPPLHLYLLPEDTGLSRQRDPSDDDHSWGCAPAPSPSLKTPLLKNRVGCFPCVIRGHRGECSTWNILQPGRQSPSKRIPSRANR